MEVLLIQLLASSPSQPNDLFKKNWHKIKRSGVYMFSELDANNNEKHLYIGQSNDIGARLMEHCAINSHKKANLAYMYAVERSGLKPIPGSPSATKESMFTHPRFSTEFYQIICVIKRMNYRWIELPGKLQKNLFEIYASVITGSKYNDFF